MSRVLIVNHAKGQHCGVYSFGERFAEAVVGGRHTVIHGQYDTIDQYLQVCDRNEIDVAIFNYMGFLMPWADGRIREAKAVPMVLQHLYDPTSIQSIAASYTQFDWTIVCDPTIPTEGRVIALGRPTPRRSVAPRAIGEHVQIGSMGFGLGHKGFELIAREINRCFDSATFNLHMTVGDFTGDYSAQLIAAVEAELTKPGVRLNWTSDYCPDDVLVARMARNDINALFYQLPPENAGLSSSADYMVAAQRPLLTTDCASFRHLMDGTYRYPAVSFDAIVGNWEWCQNNSFKLYERTAGRLGADFDAMIDRIVP